VLLLPAGLLPFGNGSDVIQNLLVALVPCQALGFMQVQSSHQQKVCICQLVTGFVVAPSAAGLMCCIAWLHITSSRKASSVSSGKFGANQL
jgi:hypothetical protein